MLMQFMILVFIVWIMPQIPHVLLAICLYFLIGSLMEIIYQILLLRYSSRVATLLDITIRHSIETQKRIVGDHGKNLRFDKSYDLFSPAKFHLHDGILSNQEIHGLHLKVNVVMVF